MAKLMLFYRKKYPAAFSIERLFDQLARKFSERSVPVVREELPYYNNTLTNVAKNIKWARARVRGEVGNARMVKHITGDVTSILFGFAGPSVITIHDCNPLLRYSKMHPRYWFYRFLIYDLPAFRADAITVISEKTKVELSRLTSCPMDKVTVIPNFVDPEFTFEPRAFNVQCPVILQIGVKTNKNLGRLAEALGGISCKLFIVGEPLPEDRAKLDEEGIDYEWATRISDEELRQRYRDADLLSFVSTYEGFGLPILEAQLTGRPVLTSNISPHKEVASEGGAVLVNPLDTTSIREGLLQIINDGELRALLIDRGRENARRYEIDQVAQQYLDLYENLS